MFYVNPRYQADFWEQGLRQADDFFVCSDGVAVGRHAARQVRRIAMGEYQIFLKREEPVKWKDRLEAWWHGFGYCSKARREWQILVRLRERGLPCPEPIAVGEEGNLAFLVVRGFKESFDLPLYLAFQPTMEERHTVFRNIGHAIADLHTAGFTHPDLYAKHVFVHRPTLNISFVDFQRTRQFPQLSLKTRALELARLDATLHPGAVPFKERLTVLHAYLHRCFNHVDPQQVRTMAAIISRESQRLLRRKRIQRMHTETAQLSGDVSIVSYYRVRVPAEASNRMTTDVPQSVRRM
jgi:tRNA A-37 threonylcarbamoyl transferase component Bud32